MYFSIQFKNQPKNWAKSLLLLLVFTAMSTATATFFWKDWIFAINCYFLLKNNAFSWIRTFELHKHGEKSAKKGKKYHFFCYCYVYCYCYSYVFCYVYFHVKISSSYRLRLLLLLLLKMVKISNRRRSRRRLRIQLISNILAFSDNLEFPILRDKESTSDSMTIDI